MLFARPYTPRDVIRILRYRWWMLLLGLAVGSAAGVLAFMSIPARYQAETVIMVVQQEVPENYVKALLTGAADNRLRAVSAQIESRSTLERIIREFNLYSAEPSDTISDQRVERARASIDVGLVGDGSLFRVSYTHTDPVLAQRVTDRLAAIYIEENGRDRERLVGDTTRVLDLQLQDAKKRLMSQEARLDEYRRQHAGELPSQLQGNIQAVQSAQAQLQSTLESMNRARDRRQTIDRQLADARSGEGIGIGSLTVQGTAAALQLDAARLKLTELKQKYTQDYPDVVSAEQLVRELESQVRSETASPSAVDPRRPLTVAEQTHRKHTAALEDDLKMIDRQIAAGEAEQTRLRASAAEHQSKIDLAPARESQLVELTRDYTAMQDTYSNLLQKREDSALASRLERRHGEDQFRILNPASLPVSPENADVRLGVLVGSVVGGLLAALLLAGWLDMRRSAFRREEDVMRALSLPVLALVPRMEGPVGG